MAPSAKGLSYKHAGLSLSLRSCIVKKKKKLVMVSSVITPALKRWRQTHHQGWMTIHHLLAGQYHVIQDPISNKQQKRWNRRHDRQGGPPVPTCTCVYKDTQEYTPQKWLRMASLVFISYTTNMATLKYSWMILLALVKALEFHYCLSHSNPKLHNAPKSSFFFFHFWYLHDATNGNSISALRAVSE